MALFGLHLLSPEFAPSWRMVSEYANGRVPWLLAIVFVGWAVSSFALVVALLPLRASGVGATGLLLLALAGIGQAMGALFDINHALHGPAAMLGIPSLCAAAVLVTRGLARRTDIAAPPRWMPHLPWLAFVGMLVALGMFVSALRSAGLDFSGESGPLTALPPGVSGYVGWANRLLFVASYAWAAWVAREVVRAARTARIA